MTHRMHSQSFTKHNIISIMHIRGKKVRIILTSPKVITRSLCVDAWTKNTISFPLDVRLKQCQAKGNG